jgi:uncharacterized membrane protein YcaP (DUF421 family)
MLLIATLVGWNYLMDWATWRFPALERWASGRRQVLVRNGRLDRRVMRRELITQEELLSKVHGAGLESLDEARAVFLEPDGEITVVKND